MGCPLDIQIGGLSLPRKDDVNVVVTVDPLLSSGNFVGVEHADDVTLHIARIVRQDLEKTVPRGLHVPGSELPKLLPRENNVVSVHEKIFLIRLLFRLSVFRCRFCGDLFRRCLCHQAPVFDRSVCALEDGHELPFGSKTIRLPLLKAPLVRARLFRGSASSLRAPVTGFHHIVIRDPRSVIRFLFLKK